MAREEICGIVCAVFHGWPATKSNQKQHFCNEVMLFASRGSKNVK